MWACLGAAASGSVALPEVLEDRYMRRKPSGDFCSDECETCQEEIGSEGPPPYDAATATGMYDRDC